MWAGHTSKLCLEYSGLAVMDCNCSPDVSELAEALVLSDVVPGLFVESNVKGDIVTVLGGVLFPAR